MYRKLISLGAFSCVELPVLFLGPAWEHLDFFLEREKGLIVCGVLRGLFVLA